MLFCNVSGLKDIFFTPPGALLCRPPVSLAGGLINHAANPARIAIGISDVLIVALVLIPVDDGGDDALAKREEVAITAELPFDLLGREKVVGIECSDEFFTEG